MIVNSYGQIRSVSAHDHGKPSTPAVSDGEMGVPKGGRVWQTVSVTSGRIIIGWRVGT
jgi:hypothetical protein